VKGLHIPTPVKDYFLARNLVYSALGFSLFNLCYYLVAFSGYTAVSVVLYLLLVVLAVTLIVLVAMTVLHKFQAGPAPPAAITAIQLDPVVISDVAQGLTAEINCGLRKFAEWRSCTNLGQSIMALFGLFIGAKIAQCFSLLSLTYIAGLLCFLVPPIYTANKVLIDNQLILVQNKIYAIYGQIYDKLPPQLRQAAPQAPQPTATNRKSQ